MSSNKGQEKSIIPFEVEQQLSEIRFCKEEKVNPESNNISPESQLFKQKVKSLSNSFNKQNPKENSSPDSRVSKHFEKVDGIERCEISLHDDTSEKEQRSKTSEEKKVISFLHQSSLKESPRKEYFVKSESSLKNDESIKESLNKEVDF